MISRRYFLGGAVGLGSLAVLPAGAATRPRDAWLAAIGDSPAVRSVGAACLRCGVVEADRQVLLRSLMTALATLAPQEADPAAIRAALGALRRSDFAAGEVVNVDGWILARSEARAYAFAALSAPLA